MLNVPRIGGSHADTSVSAGGPASSNILRAQSGSLAGFLCLLLALVSAPYSPAFAWDPDISSEITTLPPEFRDDPNFKALPVTQQWTHAYRDPINNGSLESLGYTAGEKVNFRVRSHATGIGSVHLELSGPQNVSRTDNAPPYTLFEDIAGQSLPAGSYQISITAYPEPDQGGTPGTTRQATFSLVTDTKAPSVGVLCVDEGSTTITGASVVIEVSEPPVGFNWAEDIEFTNVGSNVLAGVQQNRLKGLSYQIQLGPQSTDGEATIMVPAGVAEDEAGNANTASGILQVAQDRTLSVSDATATVGNILGVIDAEMEFEVTLNAANDCETVTVDWSTEDGTALYAEDFIFDSGTLTFGPGETTKTISVRVLDDMYEDDVGETFTLQLSNASGATLAKAEGTGTILNPPEEVPSETIPPTVSVQCAVERSSRYGEWVEQPGGGRTRVIYPGPQVTDNHSVWWELHFSELVDDVSSRPFTLTSQDGTEFGGIFAWGGTGSYSGPYERTMRFGGTPKVPGSAAVSELNGMIVSVPAGAWQDRAGNPNTASANTLYLAHNWTVSIADANAHEGKNDVTLIYFDVSLNARDDCKTVTVDWSTVDGTAKAGEDYIADSGTLTFGPGETIKTVEVVILDDKVEDSGEIFTLQLSNASTVTLSGVSLTIGDAEATGTIFNEESPFASPPEVAGVPQVGSTLEVSFTEAPTGTVTYQWLRGTQDIAGATASTYGPTTADVGEELSVRVASGSESLTSEAIGPVWPAPGNPALADGEEELLSTTMTVGSWHGFPLQVAGYGRVLGASFGEMDGTSFEDGDTTHALDLVMVNSLGQLSLATGATPPEASGLVVYWNGHRISGFEATTASGVSMLVGSTPQSSDEYQRYTDGSSDGVRVAVSLRRVSAPPQEALTAKFKQLPTRHTDVAFTFQIEFSEALQSDFSYKTFAGVDGYTSVLSVTNGEVEGARRIGNDWNKGWEITVVPDGTGDVVITLPVSPACGETGATCTDDDRPLSVSVTATVPMTPTIQTTPAEPFQVKFKSVPDEHDGSSAIVFEVEFTKPPKADYSYKTMRDHTLKIRQGSQALTATKARRLNGSHNDRWEVTITPVSKADLAVSVGPESSCTATGAVCTADDEALSNTAATTILGPPGLSVADAQVTEAAGATVDFVVSLSRSSASTVTVDYATSDGTAAAGSDYTSTSGTLTFAAGDTEETVSVPVLEDSVDEGQETFTLTLSSPSGGNAYLSDAEATGTIENSDPLPRAWLARFGRTAATHVLDAVEERLQGSSSESWVRLGGHQIGGVSPDLMESARQLAPRRSLWEESTSLETAGQDMTLDQLLLDSAFHLVSNAEEGSFGPRLTAWGRVATSGFDGDEDHMTLTGTVTTATLGVDGVFSRWLTGLALAYSEGDGSFTQTEASSGDVTSTLTSVHPYIGYALSDRVRLWGMVGYGSGSLELALNGQAPLRTDIDMTMGALGVRGTVLKAAAGFELAVRSDVLWVNTGSAATPGMVQTDADTNRLRLVLEGSRPFSTGEGGLFTPTFELGLRRDGGDAEEGSGVEVGGRLLYASPSGLSIEAALRALVAHEASSYREWGASGALRYDPGQSGIGLTASITPTWGMATSGVGRLWSQPDGRGLGGGPGFSRSPAARVDAVLGYGLQTMNGQGVLTPYARGSLAEGSERAWHVGTRLALAESLNVSLEATHRQRPDEVSAQELALLATVPW